MNITLKLGTYNFLKNQQTSADTLLKPLFDDKADHLLIKVLAESGQYRKKTGSLISSNRLYLLTYLKFNKDQAAIFDNKMYSDDFIITDKDSEIFQKKDNRLEYLVISTFPDEESLKNWRTFIKKQINVEIQRFSEEPFGFFLKEYELS
ncbi:hypothetical protein FC72_GL001775 [Companilactobacillus tucceti DSM 20183]|uniref:Uncharacterized protein n=1 Tax=Companilactobacillus tucceti DSM 20183 TaxID=1423811 RepID=A0A0R1J042_9LACO|nr:hypothetical protein [Companilactobacillus tucceti]KRK64925.1 hypothetical protein FC72_GL001775 [Companilactobacillus tucceti DSM 20183]